MFIAIMLHCGNNFGLPNSRSLISYKGIMIDGIDLTKTAKRGNGAGAGCSFRLYPAFGNGLVN